MTFTESGLHFTFDDSWIIQQYDAHRFYKGLSGAGLKAVDFLGIWEQNKVVLFEVKNYRWRNDKQREMPIQVILDNPGALADTISRKVEDTLRAIDTIHSYYSRKWWFRPALMLARNQKKNTAEWFFWHRLYELINREEEVWIIFWMETEQARSILREELASSIKKGVDEISSRVFIANRQQHPFGKSLTVRLIPALK